METNSLVFVYYGMLDEHRSLKISPGFQDEMLKKIDNKKLNELHFKTIMDHLDEANANYLYILDCCYGGAAYRASKIKTKFLLASAGENQISPQYGTFTHKIIDYLKKEDEFDLGDLANYLQMSGLKSTPCLMNFGSTGNIIFNLNNQKMMKEKKTQEELILIDFFIILYNIEFPKLK